jgi:PAS domain S-box-containing protein
MHNYTWYKTLQASNNDGHEICKDKSREESPFKMRKILLVINDEFLRKTLYEICMARGYRPLSVCKGKEVLRKLTENKFSTALIDFQLEDISGFEVMSEIREHSPEIECIMLTGNESQETTARAISMEAFSFFHKPYDLEQLMVTIQRAVESYETGEVLKESEEKYRRLLAAVPDAIMVFNADTHCFININESCRKLYKYSREEFKKLAYEDIVPEIGGLKDESSNIAGPDRPFCLHKKKDGVVFPVEVSSSTFSLNGQKVICNVIRDISERTGLEAKLRQSQRLEAIGRLAGGIAHDFNNLLTIILGYSDLIIQKGRLSKDIETDIQEIRKSALRATTFIQQLLAFSRKQILQPKVINLNNLFNNLEKMLKRFIGEDITLIMKYDTELGFVEADPSQIEQVIMNLAINARDAMPKGGRLTIETTNQYLDECSSKQNTVLKSGNYILLTVSDTGHGMDQETKEHIFEPFFTTKDRDKGTGLGLSTVYGIIKQSGGYIWVYSETGHGTTFKIYLPRICKPAVEKKEIFVPTKSLEGVESILVVEDEDALRHITCKILKSFGYIVREASNGIEALGLVGDPDRKVIKLLITDVIMPEMSGQELVEKLLSRYPGVKVLFISGYTEDVIIQYGISVEEVAFLQKPFSAYSLARKVRAVLEK